MLNHFTKNSTQKSSVSTRPITRMLRTFVLAVIIFELAAGGALVNAAGNQQKGRSSSNSLSFAERAAVRRAAAESSIPPLMEALEQDPFFTKPFEFSKSDSAIDQDPFFLRSQKWTASNSHDEAVSATEEITYRTDESGFEVLVPGADVSWKVAAPIHPVFQTDEYLFLAANVGSDLFSKKFATENAPGGVASQGLFIVPISTIYEASLVESKVAIYFFPLPGDQWQTTSSQDVGAVEDPSNDLIILKDTAGRNLPVLRAHIAGVIRAENINLSLASMDALKGVIANLKKNSSQLAGVREKLLASIRKMAVEVQKNKGAVSAQNAQQMFDSYSALTVAIAKAAGTEELIPPRGSTAGFGSLYVGYDLDRPNSGSLMSVEPSQDSTKEASLDVDQLLNRLASFLIPSAQADMDPVMAKKVMDFAMHAVRILATCSGIYLAGVAGYYAFGKKVFQEKGMKSKGVKATFDILAHSFTTVAQIPATWSSNILEYFLDRVSVSENGWVRKLFNATFGFARKSMSKTPVNARTLLFGVVLLGGTDTLLVAYQIYFFTAQCADGLAAIFPFLAERVNAAYHSDNPNIATYNLVMVLGNFIAYLTTGAFSYAHDVQEIEMTEANRVVRQKMIDEGQHPDKSENKALFEARVEATVREKLSQKGLPNDNEFLFDANTVYRNAQNFLGGWGIQDEFISTNALALAALPDEKRTQALTELKDTDKYAGIRRQGLMPRAIELALKEATLSYEKTGSESDREAVAILNQARRNTSLLGALLTSEGNVLKADVMEVWRRHKQARQDLIQLTFNGSSKAQMNLVPSSWSNHSEAGAKRASEIFKEEFFALLGLAKQKKDTSPTALVDSSEIKRAIERARERAIADYVKTKDDKYQEVAAFFELRKGNQQSSSDFAQLALDPRVSRKNRSAAITGPESFNEMQPEAAKIAVKYFQAEYDGLKYDPMKKETRFAQWQMRRAIQRANARFSRSQWRHLRGLDHQSVIETNPKLRKIWLSLVREELIHESGILPAKKTYLLNQEVEAKAEAQWRDKVQSDSNFATYLQGLPKSDQARIEATIKADAFVANYVEATISKDDLDPLSVAKPGIFQKLRQTEALSRAPSWALMPIRIAEAMWTNTHYGRGLKNMAFRQVFPMLGDVWQGYQRVVRRIIVYMPFTYAYNLTVWGNGLKPWPRAVVQFSQQGATVIGPWTTTNRMMSNVGWKPGIQASSMIKYATIGSFATCFGFLLTGLLDPEITAFTKLLIDGSNGLQNAVAPVTTPIAKIIGTGFTAAANAATAMSESVVGFCSRLLTGK